MKKGKILVLFVVFFAALSFAWTTFNADAKAEELKEYYKKNGIASMVRTLSKTTGFPLKRIYELYPSGPGKGSKKKKK